MSVPVTQARELIDSGRFSLLSLDIFDTAVWRTFPAPTDLFFSLGRLLLERGILYASASAASFGVERMEAEKTARSLRGDAEVTLQEIYRCFPSGYLRQGKTSDILQCELELEAQSTFPDPEIAQLIDYAVASGLQLAYVSDTYFDERYLRQILPVAGRFIINSCQYRRPKVRGLHSELIRKAGVKASRILHLGDNLEADFRAPASLGITTIWRPRFPKAFAAAVPKELPNHNSERASYFQGPEGDAGLTALRAEAVGQAMNWDDSLRGWGALVLGPMAAAYGQWVIERCVQEQMGTVVCLMREGRILKRVLDGLGGPIQSPIKTVEFFTSRYALIKASIFHGERDELQRYLTRPQPTPAQALLEPIGLTAAAVGFNDETLISSEAALLIAKRVARDPNLRGRAIEASGAARRRFLAYLKRTLPVIDSRIALVDLGYSGTIQGCLQAILDHEGIPCRTHGLYFVTGSGVRKIQHAGSCAEGYLAENGQPLAISHSFMRSPELVEQCLMCDVGTTIDYTETGEPVLGANLLPTPQLLEIDRVQQGMMDFVTRFASTPVIRRAGSQRLRPFLEAIVIRALTLPTPEEVSAFGSWVHDENFGSKRIRKLISSGLEADYLAHASAHQIASLQSANAYWIFGLAQHASPVIGEAVRSIFLRKTEPEAFNCPDHERTIYFFWNDGAAHRAEQKYTLSSRRTAWTRFSLNFKNANLFEVGFSLGQSGDLIKVGALILRLQRPGTEEITIRTSARELNTFGLERVTGSYDAFHVIDVAGFVATVSDVQDFTGVVHADILFSQLPGQLAGPVSEPMTPEPLRIDYAEKETACLQ